MTCMRLYSNNEFTQTMLCSSISPGMTTTASRFTGGLFPSGEIIKRRSIDRSMRSIQEIEEHTLTTCAPQPFLFHFSAALCR